MKARGVALARLATNQTCANSFSDKQIWVTEYALNNADLASTQAFFIQSLGFLEGQSRVERYAYFGAFRSDVSNVGPNVAMLDPYDRITDIGAWYLGQTATGWLPVYDGSNNASTSGSGSSSSSGSGSNACTADHPCGKGNGAVVNNGAMWMVTSLATLAVGCWALL